MFRDPSVPHAAGSVDPARDVQTMEDEVILADLGVVERRLERLERDLKKAGDAAELEKEQELLQRCRDALEDGQAAAHPRAAGRRRASGCAASSFSRRSRCCWCSISTRRICRRRIDAVAIAGLHGFRQGREHARRADLREDRARDRAARSGRRRGVPGRPRPARVRARPRDPRQLRPARLHLVLHRRRGRVPRLVDSPRHQRAERRRARSTPTSSAASSAPRSCRYEHLLARGTLAACRDHGELRLEGKEYVVLDGDIINFRHAT